MNAPRKTWLGKIMLAVILIGLAAATYGSVQRVDYQWRWYRVPQYFVYQSEELEKMPFDGTVKDIDKTDGSAQVTVLSESGEERVITVEEETLKVDLNEDLWEGDVVGFTTSWHFGPLVWGLVTTLWISAAASVFALFLGLFTGLARVSNNYTLSRLALIYVEIIRGTPLLVQIFIAYFFIGTVFDLNRNVAGIGALGLFAGAYVAEIVRGGIQSISRGQMEAARSLGMTVGQAMMYIILPQAFKRILPPLSGTFINLIKDSSLVSIIAITDLTKSGREIITSTFATFEIWLVVAAMYLIVTSVLSQFVYHMERRLAISD